MESMEARVEYLEDKVAELIDAVNFLSEANNSLVRAAREAMNVSGNEDHIIRSVN